MELIKKETSRKQIFQKRKTNLVKKISELSILCGVDACLIVYAPAKLKKNMDDDNNNNNDVSLELDTVWPSDSEKLENILKKYKNSHKSKRKYTSDYFAGKKKKTDSDISKVRNQIKELKYPTWDSRLNKFSLAQLRTLVTGLDRKIEAAGKRLNSVRQINNDDAMSPVSEGFGMHMNRQNFEAYPLVHVPMPMPMHVPVYWFMNWPQQQQVFADSNSMMMIPNGGNNSLPIMFPRMVAPLSYQLPPPHHQGNSYSGNSYSGPGLMDLNATRSGSEDSTTK